MGLIMKNGISYGGNTNSVDLTMAEYLELEKNGQVVEDTTYYITDESVGNQIDAELVMFDDTNTQMDVDNIQDAVEKCFQYASNGKRLIVDALTGKGIEASTDYSFAELATLITEQYSTSQTITYMVDTGTTYTEKRLKDSDVTSPETFVPSKSGYTFVGWRSDKEANLSVLDSMIVGTNDITLYAVFKKVVTVSYNAHGGSGSTSSQTGNVIYNNKNVINPSFTLRANGFTVPSDSTFHKWAQGSAGGTQYAAGTSVTLSANTTFYAIYIEPLVPKLSSNSGTGVTVSANSTNTNWQAAWKAFDNDGDSHWACKYTTGTNWLLINFTTARQITKAVVRSKFHNIGKVSILGSNDNSNWTTLVSSFTPSSSTTTIRNVTKSVTNTNSFKYFKLKLDNCTADAKNGMCATIMTFQVYGPKIT